VIGAEAAIRAGASACPVAGFHRSTVPAAVPVASVPLGANATEVAPLGGLSVCVVVPLAGARMRTRPSGTPAASRLPSGENANWSERPVPAPTASSRGGPTSVPVSVRHVARNAAGRAGRSGVGCVSLRSLATSRLPSGEKASAWMASGRPGSTCRPSSVWAGRGVPDTFHSVTKPA
jgi:hypothetical protein